MALTARMKLDRELNQPSVERLLSADIAKSVEIRQFEPGMYITIGTSDRVVGPFRMRFRTAVLTNARR